VKHAFVTGATGFLGRNLIEQLVREDWRITALCLPTDKTDWLNLLGATVAIGNITDRESLVAAMPASPDAVFHAAANTSTWSRNDEQQSRDNIFGTELMLDVAVQSAAKRFIYTSSISAFGYQPGICIDENTPSNAMTCGINYGKTKYLAEELVRKAVQRGLFSVILNPVNMLGRYDVNNWTKQLIRPVIEGKLRVVPPGRAMWCYVKDAVDAHIAAVDRGAAGENYLIGGVDASWKEVINEIQSILGEPLSSRATPKIVFQFALVVADLKSKLDGKEPFLTPERYKRAVAHIWCNYDKAVRDLGLKTTPLRVMLEATINWLHDEHLIEDRRMQPRKSFAGCAFYCGVGQEREVNVEARAALVAETLFDAKLGIAYVEVNDEPNHVEQFRNECVRVYMAMIVPGTKTLYHRHCENTLYVAIEGGIHHNDVPGTQKQRSVGLPRSLGLATKVVWMLRRLLFGTVDLPTSTIVMQYHRDFPIIHRICASAKNKRPMKLLGVEVFLHATIPNDTTSDASSFPLEYMDNEVAVYRIRLDVGRLTGRHCIPRPSLLVMTVGNGSLNTQCDVASRVDLGAGNVRWFGIGASFNLTNTGSDKLDALLVTIK
jgi:nucleoside-diphosphate-sugar epimerase